MQIWRVLVSHPDDVLESIITVKRAVHFVNELLAQFGVPLILDCRSWSDVTPGVHSVSVQQKIEENLRFDDCDIVVGIFWKRLGTKKKGERSGCEREFDIALEARKRNSRPEILTYFNQEPSSPSSGSIRGARNQLWLAKFKKHLQESHVQTTDYTGDRELEHLLIKHLASIAARAKDVEMRLHSKISGKVFFTFTDFSPSDFRSETRAERVRDLEFKFELPADETNRNRELDIELTLSTSISTLIGDRGPRLIVRRGNQGQEEFFPRIIEQNKLRFERVAVPVEEITRVVVTGIRCDANRLATMSSLRPAHIWMFARVTEGPRVVDLDLTKIQLGPVRPGMWFSVMDRRKPYVERFSTFPRSELSRNPRLFCWLRFVEGFSGAFKTRDEEAGEQPNTVYPISGTRFFVGFSSLRKECVFT